MNKVKIKKTHFKNIFLLFSSLFIGVLNMSSCKKSELIRSYSTYESYKIKAEEFLKKYDGIYTIYVYSEMCPPCIDLKEDLFNKLDKSPKDFYIYDVTYFSDTDKGKFKLRDDSKTYEEMKEEMLNKNNIKDIYILETPSLYIISETGQLKDVIFDFSTIKNILISH